MTYTNKNWPKEPTAFDKGHIENAIAKRARKNAHRLLKPLVIGWDLARPGSDMTAYLPTRES